MANNAYRHNKIVSLLFSSIYCVLLNSIAHAAPGELSDQPLSLVTSAKPNILLLLDDSGSMTSRQVITNGAQDEHELPNSDFTIVGVTVDGDSYQGNDYSIAETDARLLQLCSGYNALAFDPTVKYEKWQDYTDSDGTPVVFADNQSLETTLLDPRGTFTRDLRNDIYIRWDDDGNGVYDIGECGPGVIGYDANTGSAIAMPTSGTERRTTSEGIFTDSNSAPGGKYSATDSGTFEVVVDGGGDVDSGEFITFTISIFNLDSVGGGESLTIHGGTALSGPIADTITVTKGGVIKTTGGLRSGPDNTIEDIASTLSLNKSYNLNLLSNNIFVPVVTEFTVKGNAATFVFDGGADANVGEGFSIAWTHSRITSPPSDGVVTTIDCEVEHCERVSEMPADEADAIAQGKNPNENKQNYANWFTYYRTRDFVAKKALSSLVFTSDYRVGLAMLNDTGDGGAIIKDLSNTGPGFDDMLNINKDKHELLEKLYAVQSGDPGKAEVAYTDGTDLINALDNAGRYFQQGETPDPDFFGTELVSPNNKIAELGHEETDGVDTSLVVANSPIFTNDNGGQCQQNFTLLFTDGAYDGTLTNQVDNVDNSEIGNIDGSTDTYGEGVYADGESNTLADVAMYYFGTDLSADADNDLRVDLHGQVIRHQHMVTFGVGFGVNGNVSADPATDLPSFSGWPSIISPNTVFNSPQKIDDLRHAAFNSRGGYFSATNVQTLEAELENIITEIGIRLDNTAAGASFSAFELDTGEFRYDVTYNTSTWWGELEAFEFDVDTAEFSTTRSWSVDEKMTARTNRATSREIITYNGTQGIAFAFPEDYQALGTTTLNDVQVADLLTRAPFVTGVPIPVGTSEQAAKNQVYGNVLVDYLRGGDTHDGLSLDRDGLTINGIDFDSGTDSLHVFRDRDGHYIGGLIHSQPEFVGAPDNNYPDDIEAVPYSDFVNNDLYKNRRPMLYVGGNDGMLHGFFAIDQDDDDDGTPEVEGGHEVFAYIPNIVSDPTYGGKGLNVLALEGFDGVPYVDASPIVADVFVDRTYSDGTISAARWRSYLVSGLRAGGRGIYILDVTNPDGDTTDHPKLTDAESLADKIVVREFTHEHLGFVYGEPRIAKMNNGRWAAIVGNGYNSSSTGEAPAALFVIYLDEPKELTVSEGVTTYDTNDADGDGIFNNGKGDYSIIVVSQQTWVHCANENNVCTLPEGAQVRYGAGDDFTTAQFFPAGPINCDNDTFGDPIFGTAKTCQFSDNNGLSQPAVIDTNADGIVDRVYAGDLHGNLWIFDVSNNNDTVNAGNDAGGWGVHDSTNQKPFFTACSSSLVSGVCPAENRQPITSQPLVLSHPLISESGTAPNRLVFFGSGQYVTDADKDDNDLSVHSFYGIWDAGSGSIGLSNTDLQQQIVDQAEFNGNTVRTIDSTAVNYAANTSAFGWYMNLPEGKERVILEPVLFGSTLLFATLIPEEGTCNASAGDSFLMAVNPLTGANPVVGILGANDTSNLAGTKLSSVVVGLSITQDKSGTKLRVRDAAGEEFSQSVRTTEKDSNESDGAPQSSGSLLHNKGRKSWSILR